MNDMSRFGIFDRYIIGTKISSVLFIFSLRVSRRGLYDNESEAVWNILLEEMGGYQSGSKTAKQILDVVNNRVQLYLDESE